MKNFETFIKAVRENYPESHINLLAVSFDGYDLTYKGLYQRGYSNVLETRTHHEVQVMSPALKEIFDVWLQW